jgi:hypothetical protein
MEPGKTQLSDNIRWGVKFGLILSVVLIAFVSIGYIVRPESPSHRAIGWLQVSGGYLVSGLICGLVLGICRPLFTSYWRSVILGPVVALPFYVVIGTVAESPFWTWDASSWAIALFGSLIVGSIVGGSYWRIFTQSKW